MFKRMVTSQIECDQWDCTTRYEEVVEQPSSTREEYMCDLERKLMTDAIHRGWSLWPDLKVGQKYHIYCPEHSRDKMCGLIK